MSLEHCRVVLLQTLYPGNLGSTARVMRNFGLTELILVAPVADRNERSARQMSTHGESILTDARIVTTLDEAVNDCVLVIGTSGRSGGLYRQQNLGTPHEIAKHCVEMLAQDQRVALVFGPERNGLTNDIVKRCHYLIQIPTADEYASLNLAQAVAVCLYEVYGAWIGQIPGARSTSPLGLADFAAQEQMFGQLQTALEEIHFLYGDKAAPLMHAVRHLIGKARLTNMEGKVLLGLARQIRWYVANHKKEGDAQVPSSPPDIF